MALFWLSDDAWAAIEPHLPRNQPGARRVDDRRVISGILHAWMTLKSLTPDAIARAIRYALEQPYGVDVNEVIVRPTAAGM